MKRSLPLAAVVGLGLFALAGMAADWPQWRGPHRDGISSETGLLQDWPKQGPRLLWRIDKIGGGYSTPSVVGERLFVIGNEGDENEFVEALSVKDGSKIWSTKLGRVGPNKGPQYPGSRSTPTVDGDVLYALGSDGDLVCVDVASGKEQWRKNLRSDFGGQPGVWAYAESPLVDGDKLVCTPGGSKATIVALDKKTGKVIWESPIEGGDAAAYASAVPMTVAGEREYVQFLQKGIVGVDARSGKFLWRYAKTSKGSPANIPTPVVHDGYVYSATGKGGAGLVKIKGGDKVEEIYFNQKLPSAIGGSVLIDGHLYGTTGQALLCVDFKTGEVKWSDRCIGAASILAVDGRLYLHGENGDAALVGINPKAYEEHGRFTPEGPPKEGKVGKSWAYPVVANGRLYLRDAGVLWSYDVRASAK